MVSLSAHRDIMRQKERETGRPNNLQNRLLLLAYVSHHIQNSLSLSNAHKSNECERICMCYSCVCVCAGRKERRRRKDLIFLFLFGSFCVRPK